MNKNQVTFLHISVLLYMCMKKIILIVEDDRVIANLYKLKLELSGFDCRIAENGLIAFHELHSLRPDLILLDLNMPVMNGEEFLKKIRKDEKFSETPIIILTNISKEEAPRTLWHYGISNYFIKAHHTPTELLKYVGHCLENGK